MRLVVLMSCLVMVGCGSASVTSVNSQDRTHGTGVKDPQGVAADIRGCASNEIGGSTHGQPTLEAQCLLTIRSQLINSGQVTPNEALAFGLLDMGNCLNDFVSCTDASSVATNLGRLVAGLSTNK